VLVICAGCRGDDGVDCSLTDTPGLPAAKACVYQVPLNSSLEELDDGTTVVRVDGKEVDRFGPCPCGSQATEMCTAEDSADFYKRISQVDYDYQPEDAPTLASRSEIVASGFVEAVYGVEDGRFTYTRLTLLITAVHKGAASVGERIDVQFLRAPTVTDADLQSASQSIPAALVTVFLRTQPSIASHAGRSVYAPSSPQGLLVATDCGVGQPLAIEPLFDASVTNDASLLAALENLLGQR